MALSKPDAVRRILGDGIVVPFTMAHGRATFQRITLGAYEAKRGGGSKAMGLSAERRRACQKKAHQYRTKREHGCS